MKEADNEEAQWDPPHGVLFLRMNIGPHIHEVAFCYAHDQSRPRSFRRIARIRNWEGQTDWGDFHECVPGEVGMTHAGSAIVRRLAEPEDVRALARLWDDRESKKRFLREALFDPALNEASKAMIREAFGVKTRETR